MEAAGQALVPGAEARRAWRCGRTWRRRSGRMPTSRRSWPRKDYAAERLCKRAGLVRQRHVQPRRPARRPDHARAAPGWTGSLPSTRARRPSPTSRASPGIDHEHHRAFRPPAHGHPHGRPLIVGLGVVGYVNLGADLFPAVNTPIISIHSSYAGAGAEEMDKEVIKPIEDAVSGVNGIDTIRSTSGTGFGYTIVQFTMSTDMNAAVIDVQKALDGHRGHAAQGRHPARHAEVRREQPAHPHRVRDGHRHAGGAFQPGRPHPRRPGEPPRCRQRQRPRVPEEGAADHRGPHGDGVLRGEARRRSWRGEGAEPQHPGG